MPTYTQFLSHLATLGEQRIDFGLTRMMAACTRLQHPERAVPMVHVAGTNGKGSTIACLRVLLQDAGYRVGTYTSPHLCDYAERIAMNGAPVAHARIGDVGAHVLQRCADIPLTYFELTTLVAFAIYAQLRPDIVLLETGLGGRLDATNVVQPELVVQTPIAHDHMSLLGNSLAQIATEKCGIIKTGRPVVSAPQSDEVAKIIATHCAALACDYTIATALPETIAVGLAGAHQRVNAGVAWCAASVLHQRGWRVGTPSALARASWPGRCEWISKNPLVLFDGAHNVAAAQTLASYVRSLAAAQTFHCYLGMFADKDADGIVRALVPVVDCFIPIPAPAPRALGLETLTTQLRTIGAPVANCHPDGLWADIAQRHRADVCAIVTGSLSLYAMVTNTTGPSNSRCRDNR